MDQGDAAVWAAGIAAVAAVSGAAVGGLLTSRALRRQVRDQGDVEHQHWLRQERQKACTAVIDSYEAFSRVMVDCAAVVRRGAHRGADLMNRVQETYVVSANACMHLVPLGPEPLVEASKRLHRAIGAAARSMAAWDEAHREPSRSRERETADFEAAFAGLNPAYNRFMDQVGHVLQTPALRGD
ncbi:hypothetical protein [Streptomyces radiopugnans]|nr:hypothetical protein [Streptomyces radiopugnans]